MYESRLDNEIGIINQMGFAGYFLIVMEFVNWAKSQKIPVGPGRGSGAGSLVAYSLGITELDPLAYDLLFERLLNPERVSMPDFDIDFCMIGRDAVIAHVAERYGHDSVSQIVTFGTMAAKAVVRDVARVQGKPYGLADKLSKLIPFEVGMTLERAVAEAPELRDFIADNEEVAEIMDMAYKLEGIVRNVGKHAGGVVIAPSKLTDFVPLYVDDASAGVVSQFDKDDVERAGLVKFDFLGLKTLTIIDWTVAAINDARPSGSEALDIMRIPLDDPRVFDLLKRAQTTAVFQFESRGMQSLLEAGEARPFRRHHRARRIVPARADGSDSRFHQTQARPGTFRVSRSARRADPVADVRHHGVSGTGHADRAGDRRLQPGCAPICCVARWARRSPKRWRSIATSSKPVR